MAGNRIDFTVGFNIDKTGLNQLENSLDKITAKSQLPGATEQLKEAGIMAQQVGDILRSSFNYDFNQVNIGAFTQGLNSAGLSMDQLRSKFTAAGSQGTAAFSQLGSSILNTKIQIKESNTLLDQMATTMTNTVKWGIASGAFNKVTQSVREAFSYVEKLDKSLNDIRIVTDKSAESMQQFAKDANSAAKGLGASTRDYTEASLIYYQQGLSDEEVKARTETTLKTANVTGQATSAVSEELTAVWNGYKVVASEAESYVDKMAAVAADSASDLEELSTAMSKVASSASAMGVDVDSLNAQISTIISTTRQAPESVGTALKTIYARMGDLKTEGTDEFGVSLGEVSSQMQTMGVNILDETGSMRDMGEVIEEVGTKWQSWSREQKQAAAIAMAGKRQYNNLFALFENWSDYNKELKVSQESLGTLQKQQNTYMESMEAKQQRLSTQTEAFYSALIGDGQEVNNLVDVMTDLMTVVTQFTDGMGGGFKSLIGYVTILANLFKNQIGKGYLNRLENKRLENYNQSVVTGKKDTYLAGQNLQQVTGSATLSEKDNKWYVKGEQGQPVRLTSEQAGSVNRFEEEAKWAERIDKVRKSLSEEEYNALTNQQQKLGLLKEEEAILQSENIILKEQAENLFTSNGAVFDGRKKEELSSTSKSYLNYQSSIGTANEAAAAEDALAAASKRVDKARELASLSKEEFETKNSTVKTLLREAGYAEDTSLSQKEILKREKERLNVLNQVVKKRKEEIVNQENQKNTSNQLNTSLSNKEVDQTKVEKLQGAIGAASSIAMTLGSVNSILDTIFNKDISGGEKILQIFTQLAFTLPMLQRAYESLNAIQAISIGQTGIGAAAQEALNTAILKYIPSAKGATVAQTALNAAMNANIIVAVVTAILALVSAYSIYKRSVSEARQAKIEANNNIIEGNQALKDEKDAIAENAKAYNEAYNKYKETGEGKNELVTASQNLIEKLGDEGTALLSVIDNYSLFNEKLKEVLSTRLKIQNTDATSLISSYNAAARNVSLQNQEDASEDNAGFWGPLGQELVGAVSTLGYTMVEDIASLFTGKVYHAASAAGEHTYGMTFSSKEESDAVSIIEDTLSDYGTAMQTNLDKWTQIWDHDRASDFVMNFEDLNAEESVIAMQQLEKALNQLEEEGKETTQTYASLSAQYQQLDEATLEYREQLATLAEYYSAGVFAANTGVSDDVMNSRQDYEEYKNRVVSAYKENEYIRKAAEASGDEEAYYEDRFKSDVYNYGSTSIQSQYEAEQARESQRFSMGEAVKNIYGVEEYGWEEAQKQNKDFKELIKNRKNTNKDIVAELEDTGLMSYVNWNLFTREDWENIYNAKDANEAARYIVNSSLEAMQESFEKDIGNVISSGKDTMNKAISGDLTADNAINDEDFQNYLQQLEAASKFYPDIQDNIRIINNESLIGTQAWYDALDEVQDKMEDIQLIQSRDTAHENLTEIIEEYNNKDFSVNVDANTQEFTEKMSELLNDQYDISVKIRAEGHEDFTSLTGQLNNLDEAIAKVGEDFIVSADDITALGQAVPGILQDFQYMTDGTIKLNKEAVQSSIDASRQSIQTKVEEAASKLETEADYHAAQATLYEEMAEIAQAAADNDIDIEQAKNELLTKSKKVEANNDKMIKDTEIANQKKLADSSQENGGILASNWAEAYQSAALNSEEFAVYAQNNNKAATGEGGITSPNIVPHFKGAAGKNVETADIPELEQATKEDLEDLAQEYREKAESEMNAANVAYSEAMGLRAKLHASNIAADNVKKGEGPDGKDKDDDSNDLDKLTDEFDLLENINNQLEIQESYYDRINTLVEHTYGLTKLDGIKAENEVLDSQLKLYKQKDKLIQKDINRQGSKLVSYGAKFNEDGTLANHEQVWESLKAKVNKAAAAGKEVTYEKAKQDFEDYEDAYSKYNEALQESGENLAKQQELLYQEVENNVKAIEVEIQVKVDAGDAIRNLQEFRESMASEEDFVTKAKTSIATGMSYNNSEEMDAYLAQAEKARKAYNKIIKGGTDKTYGTDSEAAMKAYQEYTEKAAESAKSMKEAIDNYWSNMSDWMNSIKEDFDDIQKKIKSITDETKYYSDLLSLIHSSNKTEQAALSTEQGDLYAQSAEYYVNEQKKWNKISEDYQNKIDAQNKAKEKAEEKLKNAKTKKDKKDAQAAIDAAETNIENYEKLRDEAIENAETAQTNAQQASLNSLKAYQEAFKLSIESAFQDLEDLFTDGLGFDWADKLWSLDKDYITNWYDNIEKEFNIKDFTLMIDMDIDDTSSEAVKQKLADFRDEQEEQLRNQAYLSEYDLKLAKAKYNVLKKEIALQEAQEKKTTLRLRRNSQGNYTYQYTSNSNDIDKAQSELNQAQSDYYKVAKDGYIASYEKSVSLLKSLESDMKQKALSEGLENVDSLTQEEIETWMQEHVGDYYAKWKVEYDAAYDDYQQVQADYAEAAYNTAAYQAGETDKVWSKLSEDEKKRWIKDSLPKLGTAFTNYYSGINKNSQDMETIVKQVWKNCTKAMSDYKDGFEALRAKAEVEIPKVNDIIKTNKTEVSKLKEQWDKVDEKYKAYEKEINNSEKIEALQKSLSKVKSPIDDLYTSLDKDVRKVGNLQTAIDKLKGKTITVTTNYKNNYDLKINGKSASASEYKAAIAASQMSMSKQGNNKVDAGDYIQGKGTCPNAAGVPEYDSKGNLTGKYIRTKDVDWVVLQIAQPKNKPQIAQIENPYNNIKYWLNYTDIEKWFTGYDTGGYTGEWNSTDGKLALLHEKELVLNKQDTSNMLEIVKSVRTLQDNNSNLSSLIMEQVMSSLYSRVKEIKKEFILQDALTSNYSKEKEANIEQSVVINADFPGVTNAKEIERALNSLENMATQKAYSTRKR